MCVCVCVFANDSLENFLVNEESQRNWTKILLFFVFVAKKLHIQLKTTTQKKTIQIYGRFSVCRAWHDEQRKMKFFCRFIVSFLTPFLLCFCSTFGITFSCRDFMVVLLRFSFFLPLSFALRDFSFLFKFSVLFRWFFGLFGHSTRRGSTTPQIYSHFTISIAYCVQMSTCSW